MNLDSFSHGQIISKLWLCEELEKFLSVDSTIYILGSWYNVLGFMLKIRNPNKYASITGIDVDCEVKNIADKIMNTWTIDCPTVVNITGDANKFVFKEKSVVINTSPEHFDNIDWLSNIPDSCLICVQSSNVLDPSPPWLIKQPSPTYDSFIEKYKLSNILYSGTKKIEYSNGRGYERYMSIGYK